LAQGARGAVAQRPRAMAAGAALAAWGSPTLSSSPIKTIQSRALSPRTLKVAEHNHVCKDYLIQLQFEQHSRTEQWAKDQRTLERKIHRLKEVHQCAVFYLDKMTTKEMQYEESRALFQAFHAWRSFNSRRSAFNQYSRMNGRMNLREQRGIMTFAFMAFQSNAREFVIGSKMLNSDAKDPRYEEHALHALSDGTDPDGWIVQDPPPTEKQLRQYFICWKCAVSFMRVEGVVKDEMGVRLGKDGKPTEHPDEEEDHVQPAPAEDKPVEPSHRRPGHRRISGVGVRRGSLRKKSSTTANDPDSRMRAMLSSSSVGHGSLRQALDTQGDENANAVFLRREGFKGWLRHTKRTQAARAMLLQRLEESDSNLVDLSFQAWRYRHNIVCGNWSKAHTYAEGKERALMSRVFSGWQQGAWRKKQEAIFRLRLEHAVWELNDARLSWETEVVRLEAELAALTGLCPSDPKLAHSGKQKMNRPPPPPPLPKEQPLVGWEQDEIVEEDEDEEEEEEEEE